VLSDAINLPSCVETRDQATAGETGYGGNFIPHRTIKENTKPFRLRSTQNKALEFCNVKQYTADSSFLEYYVMPLST
jgi:hypothetical protein